MKKLSLLIALCMLISIGGVYAVWTYTGSSIGSADKTISHGLATATTDGDIGTLEITQNNADISIDQTAPGDYRAKLVVTGTVTVTFTPASGAPSEADILATLKTLKAYIYFKNVDSNLYNGSPIYVANYTVADTPVVLTGWAANGDGTYSVVITAEQIASLFDLGDEFVLPTHADYLAFHALEENITCTLMIANG